MQTPRLQLPYPDIDDGPADVPLWVKNLALALDSTTYFGMGPLSARPVSTVVAPGVAGRWYYATDVPGVIGFDMGTAWVEIGQHADAVIKDPAAHALQIIDGPIQVNYGVDTQTGMTINNIGGYVAKLTYADANGSAFFVQGGGSYSFEIKNDGTIQWGSGLVAAQADVRIRRLSAGVLNIGSPIAGQKADLAINGAVIPHPFLLMGA